MADLSATRTSARTGESNRDEWRTPLWLYDLLHAEFRFNLDPAADEENALCKHYFTQLEDGLSQEWWGNTFVNPPYSQLRSWVQKGHEEARKGNANVVMLIAARTDTEAWWRYVRHGKVRFLKGRLKFGLSPQEIERIRLENIERELQGLKPIKPSSAPFPSAIVVFEKYLGEATTQYWKIEKDERSK